MWQPCSAQEVVVEGAIIWKEKEREFQQEDESPVAFYLIGCIIFKFASGIVLRSPGLFAEKAKNAAGGLAF